MMWWKNPLTKRRSYTRHEHVGTNLRVCFVTEALDWGDNFDDDDDLAQITVSTSKYTSRHNQQRKTSIYDCIYLETFFDWLAVALGCQDYDTSCYDCYSCGAGSNKAVMLWHEIASSPPVVQTSSLLHCWNCGTCQSTQRNKQACKLINCSMYHF